jgi:hypothetical protein
MQSTSSATDKSEKKPYESPQLIVYGDIRDLTGSVGNTGVPDGGHGVHSRTQ